MRRPPAALHLPIRGRGEHRRASQGFAARSCRYESQSRSKAPLPQPLFLREWHLDTAYSSQAVSPGRTVQSRHSQSCFFHLAEFSFWVSWCCTTARTVSWSGCVVQTTTKRIESLAGCAFLD